jgi:trk system potassium uptake protein
MNIPQVARLMAGFAAFFTLAQLPPLLMALREEPTDAIHSRAGFLASMAIGGMVSVMLYAGGRAAKGQIYRKEAIAIAGLSWFLASMLGAIPFQWSGLLADPIDAVFETASGLTTCGATVLGSGGNCDIVDVPASLLLWRAMTQWIGGMGIVLVFVSLLPAMGVTAKNLLASESVGVGTDSYQPRAVAKARTIASIYVVLTLACTLLLVVIGGYPLFDALCHAFTAMATGGYSTRSSVAAFDSLGGELVLVVFMFLAGCSFATMASGWRTGWRVLPRLARTGEFRVYTIVTAAVVTAITISLVRAGQPLGTALRQATFNGVSVLTSTGYATADFHAWPAMATVVMFCAMFVGGCSGSTAGGIKQVRLLVVMKLLAYSIRHFVRPKSVERIKLDNEVLPAAVISSVLAVVLLWFVCVVFGGILVTFDERMNFVSALSASASMMGSCGPALTLIDPASASVSILEGATASTLAGTPNIGPMGGYGDLRDWTKVVFTFQMVLGRLELLTLLALFTPSFWRR